MAKPEPLTLEEIAKASTVATTTSERASEIARIKEFGLSEFIELTGVGAGLYGIYLVERTGVTLPAMDDKSLTELSSRGQVELLQAEAKFTLSFPCPPQDFVTWYDHTRATNGVSDFPLAEGFLKVFSRQENAKASSVHGPATLSSTVIAMFQVKSNPTDNKKWWDDRMRNPKKYGLQEARASVGRAKQQSKWYPGIVAGWLVDKKHLTPGKASRALSSSFPDLDTSLLST